MKKLIINAAVLTLVLVSSIPAAYGHRLTDAGKVPHILGTIQFPQGRMRNFRHTFRLQIPQESQALSQMSIDVPDGLTVKNNISVFDQSGRKINTNISANGRRIILAFPEPIASGTNISIAMRNVLRTGRSNAWLYPVSVKLVGIDADLPIGIARFHVY